MTPTRPRAVVRQADRRMKHLQLQAEFLTKRCQRFLITSYDKKGAVKVFTRKCCYIQNVPYGLVIKQLYNIRDQVTTVRHLPLH